MKVDVFKGAESEGEAEKPLRLLKPGK